MSDNTENTKSASSFDSGSFASFEKPISSADASVKYESEELADANAHSPAAVDDAADDTKEKSEGEIKDPEGAATSFGEGSFASFERKSAPQKSDPPVVIIDGFVAPRYTQPTQGRPYEPKITAEKSGATALDVFGWITFVACFPAGFVSLIITIVSFFVGGAGAILPLSILFAIAVSSIVIGVCLNKREGKKKTGAKNIVIGIIAAFFIGSMLISCIGSKGLIGSGDQQDESEQAAISELLNKAILVSDVDFSSGESAYLYDATEFGEDYRMLDVEEFESPDEIYEKIKSSPLFLDVVPNELLGLLQEYDRAGSWDFYLIYNLDTKQYNCYPEAAGEYNMLSISVNYYEETGYVYAQINEYLLTYVKAPASDF